ncbi:uncharacterized protein LOC132741471 [Ruditapes philippinarum]|uniref:uncharacterized protein LOC132741471 n=1 Tax=Ruditapes philippinarum TaxID=129788 RepID=UPI00295A75C5|nr:uncharacterized protein LOC132741471 [Ruditapes philippinarum]XP_060585633.1 uncharacterized protein LOC132741471 [Ruditapes philippinarum]XP_060585640.1 uncharacterized protein LOC132741471 [Ruditapes philippinarum]
MTDDVDGALFSRIPSKQCDLDHPSLKPTEQDFVDGALFSRIPSKQCDLDHPSLKPTEQDYIDGALFSRIPSKQCDIDLPASKSNKKDNVDGGVVFKNTQSERCVRARKTTERSKYTEKDGDKDTLECTIRPERLSDDDNIEAASKL